MIDPAKVKAFWESRANRYSELALESLGNLEQDADNLRLKIDGETSKVFDWIPDVRGLSVLDLGAGVGQWSLRFAERAAGRVLAVEYAQGMADIGRLEAQRRGHDQVEFLVSSVESFDTEEQFDLVYISGLLLYLNDDQVEDLARKVGRFVRPGGQLMVRDTTGILGRYEIDDRFSEHLGTRYSATYRTRDEYVALFQNRGLSLRRDENMFAPGHPLNKYPETRLHLFLFGRPV